MPENHEQEADFSCHPSRLPENVLLKSCELTFGRASGPGGQHRNKVETAVTIRHLPSGLSASAVEKRSQATNRKTAIQRLRIRLAIEYPWSTQEFEIPSDLWKSRCRNGKIICSVEHSDAAAMLAEAMVVCRNFGFVHTEAARKLECSGTQLLKFLGRFSGAQEYFEAQRSERGLTRLKFR